MAVWCLQEEEHMWEYALNMLGTEFPELNKDCELDADVVEVNVEPFV